MKYLIPLVVLVAVLVYENNFTGSRDNSKTTATEDSQVYLEKSLKGMVSQRGLYRLVRSGGIIKDSSTTTGKSVSRPVIQLVESTERIPLIKSAQLYLQYRIWYLPDRPAYVDLRRVLKHPEMTLPNGKVSTGSDYMIKQRVSVNQAIGYTGYGFDEDYELVEGDWVFEIWYQGKKMIEQKFTTYWPDKEEIARLEPMLGLGNKVMTEVKVPERPGAKRSWPRIVVGDKEVAKYPVLSEMKQAIDDEKSKKLPL